MTRINLCIPTVRAAWHCARHLIDNAMQLAADNRRVRIIVSSHDPLDQWMGEQVIVPRSPATVSWHNSANHAKAINALAAKSLALGADIHMVMDHDMAFLQRGWDDAIVRVLEDHDLAGATYQAAPMMPLIKYAQWMQAAPCAKYQDLPNVSCLALTNDCLLGPFASVLTRFDQFIVEQHGFPFTLVNTQAMADTVRLPVTTIWWMDTGCEIPGIIARDNLRYALFRHVPFAEQHVIERADLLEERWTVQPEIFADPAGEPFIAHFKKAHGKTSGKVKSDYSWEEFTGHVNQWIKKGQP